MDISQALKQYKKIHFIGIGGAGMSPLAEILLSRGYAVSGSDNNESDTLSRMREKGIPVFMGHSPQNLEDAEVVVHTAALLSDNVELVAAHERGLPVFERSALLGEISREFPRCVGISGTHGKTTVTSMTVQILHMAGLEPNAVIGGRLPLLGSNAAVGASDLFVCEACEFAYTFLRLSPSCSVILNVDEDHLDCFKTMKNLMQAFTDFAALAKDTVIFNGDDANTLEVLKNVQGKKMISFGIGTHNEWRAENIELLNGAFPSFDIMYKGENMAKVRLAVPGEHNVYNALAAIACAVYCGADIAQCVRGLESFGGAGRRFEILYNEGGITVVDDYAHHPAELKVTLKAAKKMNYKRVIAVFQPFTYSRTAMLLDDFVSVLKIADRVVMTEIMGAREVNTYGIYTSQLAEKIPGSVWFNTFGEVADYCVGIMQEGDLIITLGCGDIYKAAKMMIERLRL